MMKRIKHWQDPINIVIGIWLIASPWVIGYADYTAAMANSVAVGALLAAAALGAIFLPRAWEEWTEVALGLWMILSPWLLGFAAAGAATANAVVCGLVVIALALWVLATDKDYGGWLHGRAMH
jgi:heme/copper-type cytochrome/quinol oxidase subunit 3